MMAMCSLSRLQNLEPLSALLVLFNSAIQTQKAGGNRPIVWTLPMCHTMGRLGPRLILVRGTRMVNPALLAANQATDWPIWCSGSIELPRCSLTYTAHFLCGLQQSYAPSIIDYSDSSSQAYGVVGSVSAVTLTENVIRPVPDQEYKNIYFYIFIIKSYTKYSKKT